MEDRIVELETTIAFLSERVIKLEEVVSHQQLELHRLDERLGRLSKHVVEIAPSLIRDQADEGPPPHY